LVIPGFLKAEKRENLGSKSNYYPMGTVLKSPYFNDTSLKSYSKANLMKKDLKTRSLCRFNIKHLRNGNPILGRLDLLWFGEALKNYQSLQECNRWE